MYCQHHVQEMLPFLLTHVFKAFFYYMDCKMSYIQIISIYKIFDLLKIWPKMFFT